MIPPKRQRHRRDGSSGLPVNSPCWRKLGTVAVWPRPDDLLYLESLLAGDPVAARYGLHREPLVAGAQTD